MSTMKICDCIWLAWFVLWRLWAIWSKQTKQREGLLSILMYGLPVWGAAYYMFFGEGLSGWWVRDVFASNVFVKLAGFVVLLAGFAITIWSRVVLGRNWSATVTVKVEHELIRSGPYALVRHPIYTGLMVAAAGTTIVSDQWRCVVALVLLWVGLTIKRMKEERVMRQTFGEKYEAYSRSTGAILPGVNL